VQIAANHDGDGDSTASIAGQIYGAWRGLADLPNRWIRRIDVLVPLLTLAGELIGTESELV
jgi:ADP-ribosylglycohydrolase